MNVIKDDLLRWTCEIDGCSIDKHLLRDKTFELADEHELTDFKCSEQTPFLKKYGFSLNPELSAGPIFNNYRLWIDMMRSIITQYKHKDLFHVDELTMYSDVSPIRISVSTTRQDEPDTSLKKMTVLLCCNASGTEKLPLLICSSYLAVTMDKDHMYSHSEDASINDDLFREWLIQLNHHMTSNDRRILLLLHGNRIGAFQDLELSNIRHIFFPDDFSPLLRSLKRDVFHFVEMAYRSKYVEGIIERRRRWNVENVMRSLVEAWREVPRDLILASFQQTGFQTDDCFLEISRDTCENQKTGVSFRKFVIFDDHLSADASRKKRESVGKSYSYNLRTRKAVRFNDLLNLATHSKERNLIIDQVQVNGNLEKIYVEKNVDWKRKNPLKRSHDEARLDEDLYEEAKPSDESTSRENEDIVVISTPPKIVDIQTIGSIARSSKSRDVYLTTQASVNGSKTDAEYDRKRDNTANNEESHKTSRVLSNEPSIGSPEVDTANDIVSQQVFYDTSAVDSDIKEPNAGAGSCVIPRDKIESAEQNGNVEHFPRKPLKRRSTNAEKSRNNSDDGEPERKRLRSNSNWMKQYETAFVFGPSDVARTVTTVSVDTVSDNGVPQPRQRRSCETERSIFTIKLGGIRDNFNSRLQER